MKKHNLILIFFLQGLLAQLPFAEGETLVFDTGFRMFDAGKTTMWLRPDSLNNTAVFRLDIDMRTNSFLDKFYPIRDEISVWCRQDDFSLLQVKKKIREGNYHRDHFAVVDSGRVLHNDGELPVDGVVFDPIALVFKLRTERPKRGEILEYTVYDNGKLIPIIIEVGNSKTVEVPFGKFKGISFEPGSNNDKPLLKNEGHMKVILSDDSNRLPLRIEQKSKIGKIIMELRSRD